eukprot:Skav235446  [mRNA]  locus=scaffold2206:85243:90006:+ [translate_table: standard]
MSLQLEPVWQSVAVGEVVDLAADLVIYDQKQEKHLMRTLLGKKFFTFAGEMNNVPSCSLLRVEVVEVGHRLRVTKSDGIVLHHEIPDYTMFSEAVDTCSGIGVMRDGLEACGLTIRATNELREIYCEWQTKQGRQHVVQGDLGDPKVLEELHRHANQSHMLVAGFSCQPWSQLGDNRKLNDQRASALHKALFAAYHLRSHSIMLECVPQAGEDPEVLQTIRQFCSMLNFRLAQTTLKLDTIVPARRNRWWALLTHMTLPPMALRELPVIQPSPKVGDVLPFMPSWTPDEIASLELDRYETRKFQDHGGLDKAILRLDTSAPTALHGWGNQLTNCSCGCRQHPLSDARLEAKGLHGALVLTEGAFPTMFGPMPKTRHVHPWELSVLNGAFPNKHWSRNLRLDLSGLGQMASPVQSCWIVATFQSHFDSAQGNQVVPPEIKLWGYMDKFFAIIHDDQPTLSATSQFRQYVANVRTGLQVSHWSHTPQSLPGSIGTEIKNPENSQRMGRQDPQVDKESDNQPASGPLVPEKSFNQPAEKSQELQKQPATRPLEPQEDEVGNDRDSHMGVEATHSFSHHLQQITMGLHHSSSAVATEVRSDQRDNTKDEHGGLAAFAMPTIGETEAAPTRAETIHATPSEHVSEFDEALRHHPFSDDLQSSAHEDKDDAEDTHNVILRFHPEAMTPIFVRIHRQTTLGAVTVAEDKLGSMQQPIRMLNAVGVPIPLHSVSTPLQQVFLEQQWREEPVMDVRFQCPAHLLHEYPHRATLLYQQRSWVADDEMWFYLQMLKPLGYADILYPCLIQPDMSLEEQAMQLMNWLWASMPAGNPVTAIASVFAWKGQWVPILIVNTTTGWNVYTLPEAYKLLIHAFGLANVSASILTESVSSVFPHDCGFQAVQWLAHQIIDPVHDQTREVVKPITVDQAIEWRTKFEYALHYHDHAKLPVYPGVRFFAGGNSDLTDQLSALLQQHGVPEDQVQTRASTVIDKLGRGPIQALLRGSTAWRDLKSLANAATPKLQLVMGHELQQVIQQRSKEGKEFGSKKNKQKTTATGMTKPIMMAPDDVSIPAGIFQDANNNPIDQISLAEVSAGAKGIAVATAHQAAGYMKYSAPLSKHGLALLVLDHQGVITPQAGTDIRFPARCERSGEPIILGAKLLQLGSVHVMRIPPAQAAKIDEVANAVLRVVVFRDEWEYDWTEFVSKPVKLLVETLPWLAPRDGISPILECWDRQFLTERLQKVAPPEADLFCVNIRLDTSDVKEILEKSGQRGIYAEPRTPDGRAPAEQFRVIWINKSDKMAVTVASEATRQWTSLVRNGRRFGLRVRAEDAATVHHQHKPTIPWLDATQMQTWIGGPFPYGATRGSLNKLFEVWQWQARPVQAKGRSPCGKGTMWWIQATNRPKYEVYHLEHADILLTPVQSKDDKQTKPGLVHAIQASPATMKMLTNPPNVDPLQMNDPWQANNGGPSKMPRIGNTEMPQAQVDLTVSKVEQRIQASLPKPNEDQDVAMDASEAKVQVLEDRLNALEQTVQSHHTQQTLHNQKVAHEFSGLRQQVTEQSTALQQHIDSKMGEQLKHIESLLNANKARKTGPNGE